eukprot:CAMPEP_0204622652 /NCGR_PEP_ID=MMETSP0717-20131115/8336_1 /ASSEMBLY_ACC=CAM_ASM_000666 /TAXON_ID=230516 /ORGANISM="Chaetoceros curvisetus" /LENGTH=382 /DNA_ID=CAMNT_0051637457 /DNA_START=31 /DNA_END=1179 /DNA_ORIENTATION=+
MFRILSRTDDEQTRGRHERVSSQEIPTALINEQQTHSNITITNSTIDPEIPTAEAISADNDGTSSLLEGEATLAPNETDQRHDMPSSINESSSLSSIQDQTVDERELEQSSTVSPSDEMLRLAAEREIHRRKSSTCFVLVGLVLFRLWIEALINGDIALIIVVSIMTSYFIGWMKHRRAVQQDFQERIEALREEQRRAAEGGDETGGDDAELGRSARSRAIRSRDGMNGSRRSRRMRSTLDFSRSDHIDMEMLSFQAQLAFAIMESQRHIMETGGYGRPDGPDENDLRGVSDKAKNTWASFAFNKNSQKVIECDDLKPHKNEDPSCCICLCEYEEGEMLTQLKCGHVYHKECIDSWCKNHVTCPLCNLDLEEGDENDPNSIV